jgi:hypothetical protein
MHSIEIVAAIDPTKTVANERLEHFFIHTYSYRWMSRLLSLKTSILCQELAEILVKT